MGLRGRITLLVAWLLVLAGLGWTVSQRLKVSTDLRSFMPAPTTPDQRLLMEQVGDGPGSRLLLLAISSRAPTGAGSDAQLAALSQGLAVALKKDKRYSQVLNGGFDLARSIRRCCRTVTCCRQRSTRSRSTRPIWRTSCSSGWTTCHRRGPAC